MNLELQEQLLNQFFINNANADKNSTIYANPREALALHVHSSLHQKDRYGEQLCFARSYWKTAQDKSNSDDGASLFYKDPSKVDKSNQPFNWIFSYGRKIGRYSHYHLPDEKVSWSDIDETAERQTIESNLTYDGYCTLLTLLTDKELLHYQDSITKGINSEAKASLSQAGSTEEIATIHQDFLQLKAASEYLIGKAEANIFNDQDNLKIPTVQSSQDNVDLSLSIAQASQDFEQ